MATPVYIIEGDPDDTFTMDSSNVSQGIAAAKYENADEVPIKSLLVTVEDNDIRVAFDIAAVVDGAGELGHVIKDEDGLQILGNDACKEFQFISKVTDSHAKLMLTPFYHA